jgi:hypothetical protein
MLRKLKQSFISKVHAQRTSRACILTAQTWLIITAFIDPSVNFSNMATVTNVLRALPTPCCVLRAAADAADTFKLMPSKLLEKFGSLHTGRCASCFPAALLKNALMPKLVLATLLHPLLGPCRLLTTSMVVQDTLQIHVADPAIAVTVSADLQSEQLQTAYAVGSTFPARPFLT